MSAGMRSLPAPEPAPHFVAVSDLYDYRPDTVQREMPKGVMREWFDYLDGKLGSYWPAPTYSQFATPAPGLNSTDQQQDSKGVQRFIVKETANFIKSKATWINSLIKLSRIEFTHNAERDLSFDSLKDLGSLDMSAVKRKMASDGFSLSGGLRTNLSNGVISVVAEARARYDQLNTYFRYNPEKRNSILGMEYPVIPGMLLEVRYESSLQAVLPSAYSVYSNPLTEKVSVQTVKFTRQF